ncbi:hypothetical protein PG326_10550, partial [Riemerella anatipestifer]|nr:hypothetical protein [Riemerella anatipestifer]MDY3358752.1 hypothetical protein [Riemerella anatipestifer]
FKPFYILFVRFGFSFFYNAKIQLYFGSVIFSSVACNGPGIAEGGASQHPTSTEIPYSKSKQNFLKKQLTPACGNTLLPAVLFFSVWCLFRIVFSPHVFHIFSVRVHNLTV